MNNIGFDPFEFLFKPIREVVDAVFEHDEKTKGEKQKQNEPEQPPDERHAGKCIPLLSLGQRAAANRQTSVARMSEAVMLFAPCGCRCSI